MHPTLHGMLTTNCWKLVRYHLANNHNMKIIGVNDFCDIMAKRLFEKKLEQWSKTRS